MKSFAETLRNKNTDKFQFAEFYEELLSPIRDEPISLLEIGVAQGGSIEAWLEYLPNAQIYAIDNRQQALDYLEPNDRLHSILIDVGQTKQLAIVGLSSPFDIIIDDGSHINRDQIIAFEALWPYLKTGGTYVVEDVQVSHINTYIHPEYPEILDYFYPFNYTRVLDLIYMKKGA